MKSLPVSDDQLTPFLALLTPASGIRPQYKALEKRVDAAIREKFGLPAETSPEVKHADLVMLATERRDLLPKDDTPWYLLDGITPLKECIDALSFSTVLHRFAFCFGVIMEAVNG